MCGDVWGACVGVGQEGRMWGVGSGGVSGCGTGRQDVRVSGGMSGWGNGGGMSGVECLGKGH